MKTIFKNAVVFSFALFMASSFTACHKGSGSDELIKVPSVPGSVDATGTKTLVVKFNMAPQSVKFNGAEYKSNVKPVDGVQTLEVANATDGTLYVSFGTGYFTDANNKKVVFGDNDVIEIYAQGISSTPSSTKSQTAMKLGDTVNNSNATGDGNDTEDQMGGNLDGVEASITTQPGTTISGGNGNDFSIIVYTPTVTPEQESSLTENKSIEQDVLAVRCEPDGATFVPDVKVKVKIKDGAGYDIKLQNSQNKNEVLTTANGKLRDNGNDEFEADIPHFSSWIYTLTATITKIENEEVPIASGTLEVSKGGRTSVPYAKDFGFEFVGDVHPVAKQFIASLFSSAKRPINSSFSFFATSEGTLEWKVMQKVRTYTFMSNNKTFQVKVWGSVTPIVDFYAPVEPESPADDQGEVVPTHNGGGSTL